MSWDKEYYRTRNNELNLSKCRLNNDAVIILCDGLITNHSIETLVLANNEISDRGSKEIGKMLPRHPNLRDLILKWNVIGNEGAAAIGFALRDSNECAWKDRNLLMLVEY